MISNFTDDATLSALLYDLSDFTPSAGGRPMAGAMEQAPAEFPPTQQGASLAPPQSVARRCLHEPCPGCGSRMVRARDLRDLCVVCGYLQAQA